LESVTLIAHTIHNYRFNHYPYPWDESPIREPQQTGNHITQARSETVSEFPLFTRQDEGWPTFHLYNPTSPLHNFRCGIDMASYGGR